jgi:uncharacterized protein
MPATGATGTTGASQEDTIDTHATAAPPPTGDHRPSEPGSGHADGRGCGAVSDADAAVRRLRGIVRDLGSCVLALSGGLDSTVLLHVAASELGDRCLAVTSESPSLPSWDRADAAAAAAAARDLGARTRVIRTGEFDDPRYARNQRIRCFYCKTALFEALTAIAVADGYRWVVDGTNADDVEASDRPGLRAAANLGIRSPLAEAGLRKTDVRAIARVLGLPDPDRPASACLASRVPFGAHITADRLRRIEAAEEQLRAIGFRQVRVRDRGAGRAQVEVDAGNLGRLEAGSAAVAEALAFGGFTSHDVAVYRGTGAGRAPRRTA